MSYVNLDIIAAQVSAFKGFDAFEGVIGTAKEAFRYLDDSPISEFNIWTSVLNQWLGLPKISRDSLKRRWYFARVEAQELMVSLTDAVISGKPIACIYEPRIYAEQDDLPLRRIDDLGWEGRLRDLQITFGSGHRLVFPATQFSAPDHC